MANLHENNQEPLVVIGEGFFGYSVGVLLIALGIELAMAKIKISDDSVIAKRINALNQGDQAIEAKVDGLPLR
ncbi:MAG: hypothetical protein P4N59_08615 [Negativicutes bacterium]|nr:hypothetical protein [Negativicutes bacterium]